MENKVVDGLNDREQNKKKVVMKVLVKFHENPEQMFLVDISRKSMIKKVNDLVQQGRRTDAIEMTLSKGCFIREVMDADVPYINADLILSENHVHRDIT